jgi:hypothetical protein
MVMRMVLCLVPWSSINCTKGGCWRCRFRLRRANPGGLRVRPFLSNGTYSVDRIVGTERRTPTIEVTSNFGLRYGGGF